MGVPKGSELLIILLVILVLFGGKKLPNLARSLGASAKEFRKGVEQGAAESGEQNESDTEA